MSFHLLDAMARGGFEEVVALCDPSSGLRAYLVVHDSRRGPVFGGVRRFAYAHEQQALADPMRLARAVSPKCAPADPPAGGGKIVLVDGEATALPAAYARRAEAVEQRAGRFFTGPDVGTGDRELGWMAEHTRYVTRPDEAGPGLLAESTGEGVFASMEAALRQVDGEVDWPRRTVVLQGLGKVGAHVARRLVESGARVKASELDFDRASALADSLELELLEDSREYGEVCDIFAPCAMGGILHDLTITRLRCRIIAGAANNVLAGPEHGDRLHERGILFAPDFVTGAGALMRGWHFHVEGRRVAPDQLGQRVGASCERILGLAHEQSEPPERVAILEADRILEAALPVA